METLELSDFVGGNVKWYKHFVERSDNNSIKIAKGETGIYCKVLKHM